MTQSYHDKWESALFHMVDLAIDLKFQNFIGLTKEDVKK